MVGRVSALNFFMLEIIWLDRWPLCIFSWNLIDTYFFFEQFKAEKCFCLLSISSISHLLCYIFVKINANDRIFVIKNCVHLLIHAGQCDVLANFIVANYYWPFKNQPRINTTAKIVSWFIAIVEFVLFFFSIKRMSLLFIDVNRKTIRKYQRPAYLFTYLLIHFENSSN